MLGLGTAAGLINDAGPDVLRALVSDPEKMQQAARNCIAMAKVSAAAAAENGLQDTWAARVLRIVANGDTS